jgi:hypothetical protein
VKELKIDGRFLEKEATERKKIKYKEWRRG